MATTQMSTTNALTRKIWAKEGWTNLGMRTAFGIGAARGAVYSADDLVGMNARGDNITYDYLNKLTGMPIGEGGTLDGNEEALNLGNFQIAMNVTRIGVMNPNDDTIEQQRTNVNFEKRTRKLIPARLGELVDTGFFYQAAGAFPTTITLNGTVYSGANRLFVTGMNTPVAPTTNRIIRANAQASDQALGASDRMTLDLIDFALEKIENNDQPIARLDDGKYVLFVSPEQAVDLKQDTTGRIQWFNAQLAMITGGKDNQFSNVYNREGAMFLGTYANVDIYQAGRVAYGVNSGTSAVITTVRRAVLMGKDALTYASPFGGLDGKGVPLKYFTQLKDYEYYKGIEGRLIYGMKKTTPSNGEDIGTLVISTYAAAHS